MSDQWMGSLAAQDQYRPLGNDPWTNTMRGTAPAPGQGFEPVQQSPVLYNTKAGPITEADIGGAIDIGMGVSGGGLKTDIVKAPGIKAFHSSPHDFDKFDLAKIGTGEGAQVYGHGLYFAENPAVSGAGGDYWKQFARRFQGPDTDPAVVHAVQMLEASGGNRAAALAKGEAALKGDYRAQTLPDAVALLRSDKPVGPRTYEVNIKADPAHMLDWDKPIGQQPKAAQEIAREAGMHPDDFKFAKGAALYRRAGDLFGPRGASSDFNVAATQGLREAGIPGIKYLDQGSRVTNPDALRIIEAKGSREAALATAEARLKSASIGDLRYWGNIVKQLQPETSNYVIFDPSIVDIMKKYGIAGAAPAGMGALAAQDAYRGDR